MKKCNEITRNEYNEYLDNINMMNVQVLEEISYSLTGHNGAYDDTHPDKIVNPKDEEHDEYFKDKKLFAIKQCMQVVKQTKPTSELECILGMLSSAKDMIELVWASQHLLAYIRENRKVDTVA